MVLFYIYQEGGVIINLTVNSSSWPLTTAESEKLFPEILTAYYIHTWIPAGDFSKDGISRVGIIIRNFFRLSWQYH